MTLKCDNESKQNAPPAPEGISKNLEKETGFGGHFSESPSMRNMKPKI